MMSFMFFLIFLYILVMSSFHSLILLMGVEFLVLLSFYLILLMTSSWVLSLVFLFVSVCLSAYGVSLLVSCYRSAGSFYLMGFKMFY